MRIITFNMMPPVNQLAMNQRTHEKDVEKLSSGLRINRAADDASSLAISEKLRAQIRGVVQAKRNIADGISMINIAEGALAEIHDANLMRMRELAIQAANDTLTRSDREIIQMELEQIKQAINDIANNTEYNTIKLLAPEKMVYITDPNAAQNEVDIVFLIDNTGSMNPIQQQVSQNIGDFVNAIAGTGNNDIRLGVMEYTNSEYNISTFSGDIWTTSPSEIQNEITTLAANNRGGIENVHTAINEVAINYDFRDSTTGGQSKHIVLVTNEDSDDESQYLATLSTVLGDSIRIHAVYNPKGERGSNPRDEIGELASETGGSTVDINTSNWGDKLVERIALNIIKSTSTLTKVDYGRLNLHIGANFNQEMPIELFDARTSNLGLDAIELIELDTQAEAEAAIAKIDSAIEMVSEERAKFGIYTVRLEHTYDNLSVNEVNTSSSESLLRDTNMATTMMSFVKNNILTQATQAMIAQANVLASQSVQLLKG